MGLAYNAAASADGRCGHLLYAYAPNLWSGPAFIFCSMMLQKRYAQAALSQKFSMLPPKRDATSKLSARPLQTTFLRRAWAVGPVVCCLGGHYRDEFR